MPPLSIEEQFDPYSFVKYTEVIGRAYQRQAIELVKLCSHLATLLEPHHHDAPFEE
jgi:hypothetical protein